MDGIAFGVGIAFGAFIVVFIFWFCFIRKQDWDGGDCW